MDSFDLVVLTGLAYTLLVVALVPFIMIIRHLPRQPMAFKWLALFLALSFLADLIASIFIDVFGINPNYVHHLYRVLAIAVVSPFFYYSIGWPSLRKPMIVANIAYMTFAITNLLYIQKLGIINTYTQALLSLIILSCCIIYFYKLIKELPAEQIHKLPLFWVVSGFFISYAGKLVIYAVTHYLTHFLKDPLIIIWIFHNLLSLIGYVLITTGVWLNNKYGLSKPPASTLSPEAR